MTAVIRLAEASLAAWIISSSSITFRSTGSQPVWTRKTSAPRIDSPYRQYVSPFANVPTSISPSSTPRCSAIRVASSGCERPENTMSRFGLPRSSQWFGFVCGWSVSTSRPGSRASVGVVALVIDPVLFGDLAWREPREGSGRDILCDDGPRRNPSIVPNLDRSNEGIVDSGPDVAADNGAALLPVRVVGEVRGDVAGADVGVLADLRVADVRGVRHLRPAPQARVLDLDERTRLRAFLEDRSRAEVAERADDRILAHDRVGDDAVRPDLGSGGDAASAAQYGERMDGRVGLELDVGLDPRRRGIDDRDAGEHVCFVHARTQDAGRRREVGARVHADGRELVVGAMRGRRPAVVDDVPD